MYNHLMEAADCDTNMPHLFSYENGIRVTKIDSTCSAGYLLESPNTLNTYGIIHGGALATLAETIADSCVNNSKRIYRCMQSSMEFLCPAHGTIFCQASKKMYAEVNAPVQIVQTTLYDLSKKVVATGTFSFILI